MSYDPLSFVYGWADLNNEYGLNPQNRFQWTYNGELNPDDRPIILEEPLEISDISVEENSTESTENHGSNIPLYIDKNSYVNNLRKCFNDRGEYVEGSLYSFTMFGQRYFTTASDLDASLISALKMDATASNGIDSQHNKLNYYKASYIPQKIEESRKALLETDGKGRFTRVKFEDDDTVYTLNVETVTDDEAYRNAMNQYYYKQNLYDKRVSDINTKTKLIQEEDRELMLKLEQLGTEQNALQNEMEACKKVVSKNIEGSFKTFGG